MPGTSERLVSENRHMVFIRQKFSAHYVLALLILAALLLVGGCGERDSRIDMRKTVPAEMGSPQAAFPETVETVPLRIAVAAMISPETTREYYNDLMVFIADQVGRTAVFSQRRTYAEVNQMVADRSVDLAFVCAGPYVAGHEEFGMELLAVPVVKGKKIYHSYIIVPTESSAKCFVDLRGHTFAFTDPHSNTGCLVPTYMLACRGETPQSFFSDFFFSRGHDNSISAVAEGAADGGAVDSLIWEFMRTLDPDLFNRTRILEKSPPYGIPPIVVHPDLDPGLKIMLKDVFLTLHRNPEAFEILNKLQIDRFGTGQDSSYDSVREMKHWVEKTKNGSV